MKTEIEATLSHLVGLPLWGAGRAADLAWFQLGEHRIVPIRRGGTKTIGTWSLHIQCAWRIRDSGKVLVASSDLYMRASHSLDSKEEFDWQVAGASRRDERIKAFFTDKGDSLLVTDVEADDLGGFRLGLAEGFHLEVFPDVSGHEFEHWRVIFP